MLYVVTHKDAPLLAGEGSRLLYVGGARGKPRRTDCEYDDVGDSISEKNGLYSELTGLYYLARNCRDPVIGLCHYRRLFSDGQVPWPIERTVPVNRVPAFDYRRVERDIQAGAYDAILPARRVLVTRGGLKTIYGHFAYHKGPELFDQFLEVLRERDPEIHPAYEAHVRSARWGSYWNMLIARGEVFREVCERVFAVLFELEARLRATPQGVPPRSMGYFSESLIPFLVDRMGYAVRRKNVVFVKGV